MTTKKVGYVYAIENNFDNSVYIGLTIKERYAQHLQAAKSNRASCILHLFMAKHGPENFTIRELRRVEYNSIIELQLVEEEFIKDFGDLNTVYNSRSYEMANITIEQVKDKHERKPRVQQIVRSQLPSKEEIIQIACEAEEYPNKKISLSTFIDLFIPQTENYGKILDDMTIEGKIHIGKSVLEWFGYEGIIKDQKRAFIKMLQRNTIKYRQLTEKDKEINQYPTIQEELQLIPSNVQHSKFLIMEPNDLKMAIMQLKTKNGHIIRQYYIDLEELLKMYVEYTLYFNYRESQRKITTLEESMAKLNLTIAQQEEDRKKDREFMRSMGIQLEDVRDQNDELLDSNKGLKREVRKVQHKLNVAVEDTLPPKGQSGNGAKRHC